jgi:cytochrome b561
MPIMNTNNQFGLMAIFLHWLMALLIIGLLALGLYMVGLPISMQKLKLYGWHKEFGILALMLVIFRLAWRLANLLPALPTYMPTWQRIAAFGMHYAFYVFMFMLPLTGWMLSSAAGLPVSFFGLFVLPDLVSPDENLRITLIEVHKWLGYALILAICGHVGATIQHYVVYKDNILRRMLP